MMKCKVWVLECLPAAGAVLDAAQRLVLSDGFAPTTIAAIAERARVSVDTVYKAFGGKRGLVGAIWPLERYGTFRRPRHARRPPPAAGRR
jgi:hypothetical protein